MEEEENDRPLVLFHDECLDGIVSAYVAWLRYREHADYLPVRYSDKTPPDATDRRVFVLDFSYPPERLTQLAQTASSVTCIDHHESAVRKYKRYDKPDNVRLHFDLEHSGAALTQRFFNAQTSLWLVDYAEDRDLWRFKLPHSREITAYLAAITLGRDPIDAFHALQDVRGLTMKQVAEHGEGALAQLDCYCRQVVGNARRVVFAGHPDIPVVNIARPMNSDALNKIAESALFAVGWYQEGDNAVFSLRTSRDFHVNHVAERFGGGGHKQAAGFVVPFAGAQQFFRGEVGAAYGEVRQAAGHKP